MTYQVNRDGTITVIKSAKVAHIDGRLQLIDGKAEVIRNEEMQKEYDLPSNEDK